MKQIFKLYVGLFLFCFYSCINNLEAQLTFNTDDFSANIGATYASNEPIGTKGTNHYAPNNSDAEWRETPNTAAASLEPTNDASNSDDTVNNFAPPVVMNPFVTRWNLATSGSGPNQLTFNVNTTGTVAYTWQTVPAGTSGAGSFTGSGNTATITGLPTNATILLSIDPASFKRIFISNGTDKNRLTEIVAWGDVAWNNMFSAFYGCNNLTTATGTPNLTGVTNMSGMFQDCTNFNADISGWNTASVTNMTQMFYNCTSFNANISGWNTAAVTNMFYMFNGASAFNQNLGAWTLNPNVDLTDMLNNSGMDCTNYSATLVAWAAKSGLPTNRTLGASGRNYGTNAAAARTTLITTQGWTITGDVASASACLPPSPFVTRWNLATTGTSTTGLIFGVETSGVVNYTWQTVPAGTSGSGTFTGTTATITGLPTNATILLSIAPANFQGIYIGGGTDAPRLTAIDAWGDVAWTNMSYAFRGCNNLTTATGTPILTGVSYMSGMFQDCTNFNADISGWNTASVNSMFGMFKNASAFNQNISTWNTAAVTDMGYMFQNATSFNKPIGSWNTAAVIYMDSLFQGATAFNQPLGAWKLNSNVDLVFMLKNSGMDCSNYSATLAGWAVQSGLPTSRNLGALGRNYGTGAVAARALLTSTATGGKSWTITGDVASASACITPEINVQGNSTNIADGSTTPTTTNHTDFGTVNSSLVRTFTIQNTDFGNLTISSITSSNPKYVIGTAPTSALGGASKTFTVTYTPTSSSSDNATITINNNDSNEAVYDFAVVGQGNVNVGTPVFTTGSSTICVGSGSTYTATASNATSITYSIVGGIGATIDASTGTVSNVTGNFTVRATAAGPGGPTTADRVVTVLQNVATPSFTAGATSLCIGGTSTYTVTASNSTFIGYSIVGSTGATIDASTGVVSGVTANFTVRAVAFGNCGPSTTADRMVTVTPNVGTPSFTAGASAICVGTSNTYTATASNSTSIVYSIVGGTGATIDASTGVVSNVIGSFIVRATATGTCGAATTADRNVNVTQNVGTPTFTAGATSLCIGGVSTYTATASNSTSVSYSIVGGTGATINASTGVVSGVTGNFTVRATATGICGAATTADRVVTVTPNVGTPSFAAGAGTLCIGGTSTYFASASNAISMTYSIVGGTGATINASTGVVSNVTSSFTVRATASGTCGANTTADAVITVIPNVGTPSFTAGATAICAGTSGTYTATASNSTFITYSIVGGIGATINSSTGVVSNVTGDYTVRATATGTCGAATTADRFVMVTPNVGTPTFTAGATTLCIGATSTYGTTTSNANSVTLSIVGGTGATINASTGVVSNVTGNFTVRATATGTCGAATTADRTVTVTPNVGQVSFVAGAGFLCIGGTSTYNAIATNATSITYSIVGGTGATINASTGAVSNVTGAFTVRATATGTCGANTTNDAMIIITPNVGTASFTAGATTLCIGGTSTYAATASNANSITYSIVGTGATIDASTGVVSNVIANFTVRATATGTCGAATTADRIVTVDAGPNNNIIVTNNCGNTVLAAATNSLLDFDGTDDYVNVGNTTELNNATQFTIEAMVFARDRGTFKTLFAKRISNSFLIQVQFEQNTADQSLQFSTGDGVNKAYINTQSPFVLNAWTHVAAVYNANGATNADKMKIFINGVQAAVTFTGTVPFSTGNNTAPFLIGTESTSPAPLINYDGQMNDVRIWTVARSAADIAASAGTCLTNTTNLLVEYKLEEKSGASTAPNSVGSTYTGTLNNFNTATSWKPASNGCAGATLSYLWSTGSTNPSITTTAAGNYTVTITNAQGCSVVGNTTAAPKAIPSAYSVTGGGSICQGGTGVAIGLSSSQIGVMYQLKNGTADVGTAVAGTGAAISFGNQTAVATYTVVATSTAGGCTATMTGNATVSIAPNVGTPIFTPGAAILCVGGIEICTASASNATSIKYSIVGGTGANVDPNTGLVSNVTGNFTIRATASATGACGTTTADRSVTVTQNVETPAFTAGATTLCVGSTANYTATANNSSSIKYSIVGGTGATINSSTGAVSKVTGNFTVRATAAGDCGQSTTADRSVTVTANVGTPSFTAGATTLCVGGAETYTASASASMSITYSIVGTGASINASTGEVSKVTGDFTVRATASGVCGANTTVDRSVTTTPNVGTPSFTAGATTLCVGGTATYTASASNSTSVTYSIVGGTGASIDPNTGAVSKVTGNYTVRATATGTCGQNTTVDRSVTTTENVGTPSFTAGAANICLGSTETYTASASNASSITYSIVGGTGAIINASTGAVSGVTGSFIVRATATGTCGTNTTVDRNVTTTPNVGAPSFTAGATTLCIGATDTYTASASSSTSVSYSIVGGAGASINASTGAVSNVTGNFTVRATATGTCGANTTFDRSVTVTANIGAPLFTTGATTLCVGGTANYTANSSGSTSITYSIVGGTGAAINSSTGAVSGVTGNFTVRATASGACGTNTTADKSVTVTPNVGTPVFTAGATTLLVGGTSTYTATASNSTSISYSIVGGTGASINASTGVVSNVAANFTVRATATGTCGANTTFDRIVTVNTTSNIDLTTVQGSLKCFPNPFSDDLNIQYNLTKNVSNVTLKVYDNQGRLVTKRDEGAKDAASYQVRWDLSDLSNAMYHVCLEIDGKCVKMERVILIKN